MVQSGMGPSWALSSGPHHHPRYTEHFVYIISNPSKLCKVVSFSYLREVERFLQSHTARGGWKGGREAGLVTLPLITADDRQIARWQPWGFI